MTKSSQGNQTQSFGFLGIHTCDALLVHPRIDTMRCLPIRFQTNAGEDHSIRHPLTNSARRFCGICISSGFKNTKKRRLYRKHTSRQPVQSRIPRATSFRLRFRRRPGTICHRANERITTTKVTVDACGGKGAIAIRIDGDSNGEVQQSRQSRV